MKLIIKKNINPKKPGIPKKKVIPIVIRLIGIGKLNDCINKLYAYKIPILNDNFLIILNSNFILSPI
jgi:hypothetical protein